MKPLILLIISLSLFGTNAAEKVFLVTLPDGVRVNFFEYGKENVIRPIDKPKTTPDGYSKVTFIIRYDTAKGTAKMNSVNEDLGSSTSLSADLQVTQGAGFVSLLELRNEASIVYTIFTQPKLKDGGFRVSCSRHYIAVDGLPAANLFWGTAKSMD